MTSSDRELQRYKFTQQAGPNEGWALRGSQAPLALAKVYQEMAGKLPK